MNTERSEFKRIATPKEPELLFIAALYLSSFSAQQQVDGSNYDIEHLAPQNLIKNILTDLMETYDYQLVQLATYVYFQNMLIEVKRIRQYIKIVNIC